MESPLTKVIAICNQKGGVGKTTTAVSLSAALAMAEKRTLLIDVDPQANASQGFGLEAGDLPSIYDALMHEGPWTLDEALKYMRTPMLSDTGTPAPMLPYLQVVSSIHDLAGAEFELVDATEREFRLRQFIDTIAAQYDYVLIDAPPSLGLLTLNALVAARSVLIPIQCEYYALQGVVELLNTIRLTQGSLNPNLTIEGALLTMHNQSTTLSRQVIEEVRGYFQQCGERVFETVVPRTIKLAEAPSHGKPILLYDINNAGAASYMKLAREIMGLPL